MTASSPTITIRTAPANCSTKWATTAKRYACCRCPTARLGRGRRPCAGVNVSTVATDVGGWNQRLGDWDYDLAFTYLYQYGDPALGITRSYRSDNIEKGSPWNNVEGYENERIDELFDEAATAYPEEEREALYHEAQEILHEDVPVGWLLELGFPTIYRCDVQNLITSGVGINDAFRDAWLDR